SVTVSYENGSLATIHYSGLRPASLPEERIEVLAGNRAWVLDDFRQLTSFDADGSRTEGKGDVDKGHAALMAGVLAASRREAELMPGLTDAYLAQSVALAALEG